MSKSLGWELSVALGLLTMTAAATLSGSSALLGFVVAACSLAAPLALTSLVIRLLAGIAQQYRAHRLLRS